MSKNVATFENNMNETLSKTKAKELKGLILKKERDRQSLFLAEGEKCVLDMIEVFEPVYLVGQREWFDRHRELNEFYKNKILIADKRGMEIISSLNSLPEIIAVFKKTEEEPVLPVLNPDKLYVLLDEIQDPGNLGTIIRTCDWFGVYDIYASKNTVDVYSPKVVQASMGSLTRVRVHYVNLQELIEKNKNIKVIGTLLNGEPLSSYNLKREGMLLMGNEGRGISDNLKKLISIPVTIPPTNPYSHPDSLNVAIATAILLSKFES